MTTAPSPADSRRTSGLVVVLTGEGKGKSSSAFGMVLRAAGWNMRVCVIQFIKGRRPTGEERAAAKLPGVEWFARGEGFTWQSGDSESHLQAGRRAWAFSQARIKSGDYDLIVLDEINYAMGYGWISGQEVAEFIRNHKPEGLHLILTGRNAPEEVLAVAHTVTRMEAVKHAYQAGFKATRGIEF